MRELTQQEIDNAPEWATHYRADEFEVQYESSTKWMGVSASAPYVVRGPFSQKSKLTKCKPIPRKTFDIGDYEFDDKFHLTSCHVDECGDVAICLANSPSDTYITKQDAIALAKHFKLI